MQAAAASSAGRGDEMPPRHGLDGEIVVRAGPRAECESWAPWPRTAHVTQGAYQGSGPGPGPRAGGGVAWPPRVMRALPDTAALPPAAWAAPSRPATSPAQAPGPAGEPRAQAAAWLASADQYLDEVAGATRLCRARVRRLYDACVRSAAAHPGDTDLWAHKYRPVAAGDVLGNTDHAARLLQWLREWGMRAPSSPSPVKRRRGRGRPRAGMVVDSESDSDSDFAPTLRMRRGRGRGRGRGGDSSDDEHLGM
jgi:hypothetical protein